MLQVTSLELVVWSMSVFMSLVTGGRALVIMTCCLSMPLLTMWMTMLRIHLHMGSWTLSTPIHFMHSGWSEIPMCIGALGFLYNRYIKQHHWYVYCWAWPSSQWSAHNNCCSPWYNIQGSVSYSHFFKPSGFVKVSTSWRNTWLIFRILCQ